MKFVEHVDQSDWKLKTYENVKPIRLNFTHQMRVVNWNTMKIFILTHFLTMKSVEKKSEKSIRFTSWILKRSIARLTSNLVAWRNFSAMFHLERDSSFFDWSDQPIRRRNASIACKYDKWKEKSRLIRWSFRLIWRKNDSEFVWYRFEGTARNKYLMKPIDRIRFIN